jgi:hypothetical protein
LEASIAGEYKKPFTVRVKTTGRIDTRHVDKISQATPAAVVFWSELTKDTVWLMKQQSRQKSKKPVALLEI